MEKLIVKNFGPIKDVEIELSQYTIFIGDTSSGKSTMAKLIAIFRDFNFIAESSYKTLAIRLKEYGISFVKNNSFIEYSKNGFVWKVFFEKKYIETDFIFKYAFKDSLNRNYNSLFTKSISIEDEFNEGSINNLLDILNDSFRGKKKLFDNDDVSDLLQMVKKHEKSRVSSSPLELSSVLLKLYRLIDKSFKFQSSIYFPTERNMVSLVSDSLGGLYANNVALPDSFKKFVSLFEVSRKEVGKDKDFGIEGFNISYSYKDGNNIVKSLQDYEISLDIASSGLQSVIPLYLVIENITRSNNEFKNTLIIEEPELNLFPKKQKAVVEYLVAKTNKTGNSLVVTTHSPYLLTVFDNLLLAKNVSLNTPKSKEEVESIVSEEYWIDYNNLFIYHIKNDGTVQSIKNDEFQSIDANVIDEVSDTISDDFDNLIDLKYVGD